MPYKMVNQYPDRQILSVTPKGWAEEQAAMIGGGANLQWHAIFVDPEFIESVGFRFLEKEKSET